MDLNMVVLCGQLSVDAEKRVFDSGSRLIHYLVVVRSDYPKKRTDVVPVDLWDPDAELWDDPGLKEDRIWLCGMVQRRYWETNQERRSKVCVVAHHVRVGNLDELEPVAIE